MCVRIPPSEGFLFGTPYMRIVSKFNDYYDSVLNTGYEDSKVFVRNTTNFKQRGDIKNDVVEDLWDRMKAKANISVLDYPLYNSQQLVSFRSKNGLIKLTTLGVLFCGKYFPSIKCDVEDCGGSSTTSYFYTAADTLAFLSDNEFNPKKRPSTHKIYRRSSNKDIVKVLTDYFDDRQFDKDWCVEHKITSAVFDGWLYINPPLKDYMFYKALDSYTAFQEIEMWLSGTLSWPFNMMIELADEYRVAAHGFDTKYGFRKRPKG